MHSFVSGFVFVTSQLLSNSNLSTDYDRRKLLMTRGLSATAAELLMSLHRRL